MASSNLTQIDTATARISQVEGILDLLTESELLTGAGGESAMSAIWGAQALLAQAHAAVSAIKSAPAA